MWGGGGGGGGGEVNAERGCLTGEGGFKGIMLREIK
jgi:hypothetical protein